MSIIGKRNHKCIERGYHWVGGNQEIVKYLDGIESPELCQEFCNSNDRCTWFNWNFSGNEHKRCALLTKKGSRKDTKYDQGASGSKHCNGKCEKNLCPINI